MVRSVLSLALVLVYSQATSFAEPPPPTAPTAPTAVAPTTPEQFDASRIAYAEGAKSYERGDYDAALTQFQRAYDLAPSPEFWFNIARCHERLGRWAEAAGAYERYLAGKPTVEDAVQIRERISDLRLRAHEVARLAQATAPPPPPPIAPPPPRPSLRVPALALLGVSVALAAGGFGAYFSEWSEYQSTRSACQSQCSSSSLDGLRTRVLAAQVSGGVLFALAGAALVADVILWVADARRGHGERRLSAIPRFDGQVRF
jgi:tetratricopeptide (TPR) repeat protein